jgi:hypothetical protein
MKKSMMINDLYPPAYGRSPKATAESILGRPKHFDQFRKLAQRISHEKVIGPDGNTLTMVESILRSWAKSKQPALQLAFVAYCLGKPPEKLEMNELEPKPLCGYVLRTSWTAGTQV